MSKSMREIQLALELITTTMQDLGVPRGPRMAIMRVIAKESIDATMREPLTALPNSPMPRGLERQAG